MRKRREVCPACGQRLARTADQCPACNYSRKGTAVVRREFWGAMIIFTLLFGAGILFAWFLAASLQRSVG